MGVIGCRTGPMIRVDSIQITPEILGLIAQIEESKGEQHLRALVEQGHPKQHGSGRGSWYGLS